MTVLALLFTIVPSIFYSMGLTFVFRDAVCVMLTPMQKVFNYATEALDGFAAYFYKFDELVEENNALREGSFGDAHVYLLDARKAGDIVYALLKEHPLFFTKEYQEKC